MDIVIPDVPIELQQAFAVRAAAEKKTVAKTILDAAARDLGIPVPATTSSDSIAPPTKRRDLSELAGTWVDDPEFDAAIEAQSQIDPELWK